MKCTWPTHPFCSAPANASWRDGLLALGYHINAHITTANSSMCDREEES